MSDIKKKNINRNPQKIEKIEKIEKNRKIRKNQKPLRHDFNDLLESDLGTLPDIMVKKNLRYIPTKPKTPFGD